MEMICPKNKCTGCSACSNVCVHVAITMTEDAIGHLHPHIDQSACVNCGLCSKVCPVNHKVQLNYPITCYAVAYKDEHELLSCASGGASTILTRHILDKGGVVYGCDGTDIRNVHHVRIDSLQDAERLKGSKYVQSRIADTYKSVKNDLREGKQVLFIGTPCQIAGLRGFLHRKEYANLLTADLVCHGVPSQKMLNDNIALYTLENKVDIKFRIKRRFASKQDAVYRILYGWFYRTSHTGAEGIFLKFWKDSYMFGFLRCATFRESCYSCRYATSARCSDFTLGDFWGLSEKAGINLGKGVSEVLVNTEKGLDLWKNIGDDIISVERDVVEAIRGNGQLQAPSHKPGCVDKFRTLYPQVGFKKAINVGLRKEKVKLILEAMKQNLRKVIR